MGSLLWGCQSAPNHPVSPAAQQWRFWISGWIFFYLNKITGIKFGIFSIQINCSSSELQLLPGYRAMGRFSMKGLAKHGCTQTLWRILTGKSTCGLLTCHWRRKSALWFSEMNNIFFLLLACQFNCVVYNEFFLPTLWTLCRIQKTGVVTLHL